MKKILAAVAVGAALASPYIIGIKAEEHTQALYQQMSANPAFEVELLEYNRGWINSDATVKFTMPVTDDEGNVEMFNFKIEQIIQHGPVLWSTDGVGLGLLDSQFNAKLPAEFKKEIINIDELQDDGMSTTARTSFNGTTYSSTRIKSTTIKLDDANLEILPGQFHTTTDTQGHITGGGEWQGMKIVKGETDVLIVGKMDIELDQTYINGNMFAPVSLGIGTSKLSMTEFIVNGETPDASMSIRNLHMASDSKVNAGLLAGNLTVSADQVALAFQQFTDFNYSMTMDNFNVDALSEIQNLLVNLDPEDPQQQQTLMVEMQQQLPKLLADNPSIAIDKLGITTSEGDIVSDLLVTIDPQKFDANNPMSMMFALQADAKGSAPSAFFTNLGMQDNVDMLKQQGMLVQEEETLLFNFSFANGQALINGMPIPLG